MARRVNRLGARAPEPAAAVIAASPATAVGAPTSRLSQLRRAMPDPAEVGGSSAVGQKVFSMRPPRRSGPDEMRPLQLFVSPTICDSREDASAPVRSTVSPKSGALTVGDAAAERCASMRPLRFYCGGPSAWWCPSSGALSRSAQSRRCAEFQPKNASTSRLSAALLVGRE